MNKKSKILVGISIAAIVVSIYYLKKKTNIPLANDWNKMNATQKNKVAESLGITVDELDKKINNK